MIQFKIFSSYIYPFQLNRLLGRETKVPVAEYKVKILVGVVLIEFKALSEIFSRVHDNPDEADGEAAEEDKEVGNSHLIGASIVIIVLAIVKVSGLHPTKVLPSCQCLKLYCLPISLYKS